MLPAAEIRFAFRSLGRRPFRTGVIVATLAIALGANTAIFSLVEAVLLSPLDYRGSESLVKVIGFHERTGENGNISPADFYDLDAATTTLESMGAHGWVGSFTVTGDGTPERVAGSNVTAGFFATLSVEAELGRVFTESDDTPGAAPTVVLSHAFWARRFGADPDVIGEIVTINAVGHELIGVLPAEYRHPEPQPDREPGLYVPYQFERGASRSGRFIRGVGRLAEGASAGDARLELQAIAARLAETYPESNKDRGVEVLALKEAVVKNARGGLFVLLGAVGAVLLIACANIANLKLAEGAERRHELSIKKALGAGRWQLVRQLVIEAAVLSGLGCGLGLGVFFLARRVFTLAAIPRAETASLSLSVLAFIAGISILCCLAFGLLPALVLSSRDMKRASSRRRPRHLLIACEVAAACVLLITASLLIGSFFALRSEPSGFDVDRLVTMRVSLPTARYEEGEQIPFYDAFHEKLSALPGVTSVGAINILPLSQNYSRDSFQIDARPAPEGEKPSAEARSVDLGYFRTMRIPLVAGRRFDERDGVDAPGVAIVSEAMAARYWPGADPLGQRITYNRAVPDAVEPTGGPGSREIVGVVGDVKHLGLDDDAIPMFYTPHTQAPSYHTMTLVIRTSVPLESLTPLVRGELEALDPDVPLYAVAPLRAVVDSTMAGPRFRSYLLGVFAAMALAVALLGVYAVIGISLGRRTQEIGVRTALGARSAGLAALLMRQSLLPVAWGLMAGSIAALLSARFVESLLFGVTASDPRMYLAVTLLVAGTASLAAAVPVVRALRLDPVKALRAE